MEFLSQYGLFLLKTLTLIMSVLILVAGILALGQRFKPKLEITSLNEELNDVAEKMLQEIKHKKGKKLTKKEKKLAKEKPALYVIDFDGDIKASQTHALRESITAILSIAESRDEILIRLESPGGVVNSYGLAASQLQRIRDKQIPLTVAIDKIAASGGYLMACVANKIIAAPFAIIGSIGVVAQMPNFHRWLKKNNIDIELLTAGEFKRTLTMFAENTEKGRAKFQEDLEQIHKAFRNYVVSNRQQLDIDKVATGEHWLASDAFDLKLVDSLKTSDDYLLEKMNEFQIYKIAMHFKTPLIERLLKPAVKLLHPWA